PSDWTTPFSNLIAEPSTDKNVPLLIAAIHVPIAPPHSIGTSFFRNSFAEPSGIRTSTTDITRICWGRGVGHGTGYGVGRGSPPPPPSPPLPPLLWSPGKS